MLLGLLIGKPVGVMVVGWLAARPLGLGLPSGMREIDLLVVGCVAAIGFTVSLFIARSRSRAARCRTRPRWARCSASRPAIIAIVVGKLTRVQRQTD